MIVCQLRVFVCQGKVCCRSLVKNVGRLGMEGQNVDGGAADSNFGGALRGSNLPDLSLIQEKRDLLTDSGRYRMVQKDIFE